MINYLRCIRSQHHSSRTIFTKTVSRGSKGQRGVQDYPYCRLISIGNKAKVRKSPTCYDSAINPNLLQHIFFKIIKLGK